MNEGKLIKTKLEIEAKEYEQKQGYKGVLDAIYEEGQNNYECARSHIAPCIIRAYLASAEPREKRIEGLEAQIEREKKLNQVQEDNNRQLRELIEKMKYCKEEIIKALKEAHDYEWLHAHNGKAKYLYLQTVIDIVNEKFEEIKEKWK